MSRETDSSSSGPNGRGGPAYPPGTEPYGSADVPSGPADQAATGPDPEARSDKPGKSGKGGKGEPKTETTLTTRIRINIPGSRPIPPVVMRTPVGEGGSAEERPGAPGADGAAATAGAGAAGAAASMSGGGSDGAQDGGGSGGPGGSGGAGGSGGSGSSGGAGGSGGEFSKGTSDWFAPRKAPKPEPDPGPDTGGTPGVPGAGGRTDLPYFTDAPAGREPHDEQQHLDPYQHPYQDHPDTPPDGFPAVGPGGEDTSAGIPYSAISDLADGTQGGPPTGPVPGVPGAVPPPGQPSGTMGPPRPVGPTTGPANGDMPLGPPPGGPPPGAPGAPDGEPPASSTLGLGTGHSAFGPEGPVSSLYTQGSGPGPQGAPGVPDAGEGGPGGPGGAGGLGGPSGPSGPGGQGGDGERIASDTLVSGIPRLPSSEGGGFSAGPSGPAAPPAGTGDVRDRGDRGDRDDERPAAKGRSKLVLVGVGLVGVLGLAYGAGLLLDHADVPNGTTVLGVDIGGKERQAAVDALDKALGDRGTAPLTVVAEGKKSQLKPSVAGLTIDTEATVRNAAGRDYNPVSVIGSLLGGSREADAAVEVDQEKLEAELTAISTETGGGQPEDGMVKFTNGKAVGVPGKPHKGVDVVKASAAIEDAYRERAATGKNTPISLPVSTQQPKIGEKEIQAAVNGFGKTAMSGWVWLKAGDEEVPFSEKTIGKFLTMQPGGDSLQPVIDPEALQETYGTAFDNVVIEGGAGTVKMTPKHAAAAMLMALRKTAPEEPQKRVAEVDGARSE
ncbi:hypothetical protein DVA86_15965 [Streptomyces armeniacus]|uniref:YoaR-like putative peptidoglycan binding domain-containing protein n=1 Tax=Streptomyces armeniacus TaxID=83291 RepID=A0A345XQL6_9ACTN|nr:hypothetical protein [Streptomyces armeniacus]AXK33932.1 hypothetical protein DVA86_15965 [Streptomyces armeniacus]